MTDAAHPYVEDKLAAWDRDFLLTRVFAAAGQRRALAALHALRAEWRRLVLEVRDPGVALAKIGWWHQEWGRLIDGRARHPVSVELQAAELVPPPIDAALTALAGRIQSPSVESLEQLARLVLPVAEPLAQLEAQLAAVKAPIADWQRIEWVALLEDLGRLAAAGRAPVPLEVLAARQLSRDILASDAGALVAVRKILAEGLPSLTTLPDSHAGIYRAVQDLKLARFRAGERAPPGPGRRLWAAWRAARAQRRGLEKLNHEPH